jgi:hypothetical protein
MANISGENRKLRDAVAAKLAKAQNRKDGLGATGRLSDAAKAKQNKRVADKIRKKQQGGN